MRFFRIGDVRHPIWDVTGAALVGGALDSVGRSVIYSSLSYSCALLEILAHANIGRVPTHHRFVMVEAPADVSIEQPTAEGDFSCPANLLGPRHSAGDKGVQQMYVYVRSEPALFTVGFYDPKGVWHPDSDHSDRESAAERVAWLNGSAVPSGIDEDQVKDARPRQKEPCPERKGTMLYIRLCTTDEAIRPASANLVNAVLFFLANLGEMPTRAQVEDVARRILQIFPEIFPDRPDDGTIVLSDIVDSALSRVSLAAHI